MKKQSYFAILVLICITPVALYIVPNKLINGGLIQENNLDTLYVVAGVLISTYGAFFGSIAFLIRRYLKLKK
jgi:hypothetical protein